MAVLLPEGKYVEQDIFLIYPVTKMKGLYYNVSVQAFLCGLDKYKT